ncbi:MAG: sugar phosphate nucleotidyltransferase [Bdellovibrionales bacterium]|jgi:NDP-sugar pyrophosphorylase family protein
MSKRAVILAGGKGTRLRPYTTVLPKPLMPLDDRPILEIVIRQLAKAGFDRVTLAVNHQAELIQAFFQDGARLGVSIDYSLEDKPLSTMGPLKLIPDLPDHFLVMNGDILSDLDYGAFYDRHVQADRLFTVSSMEREQRVDYGVLDLNEANDLVGFREKPSLTYHVSMGVYMVSRRVLDVIPEGRSYGFDQLMLDLIKTKTPATVVPFDGYWLDIGRPDDYEKAQSEFAAMKSRFLDD